MMPNVFNELAGTKFYSRTNPADGFGQKLATLGDDNYSMMVEWNG